ncbi:MAG: FecR domain-containing protein [Dysgonamonadaceae bacterium]|jgi:ferric-dicitrate binding protein FerR (iron transport regulator)|nr:FecR domain-containing protein [Dysgonamonadaceae bacterium]
MDHKTEQTIIRILSGEASDEDMILLSEWLSDNDDNKKLFRQIKSYWNAEVSGVRIENYEVSTRKLMQRIHKTGKKPLISYPWFQYTNLVVAASLIGLCIYLVFFRSPAATEQIFTCMTGNSTSNFELPDGTQITLNKHSTLNYSGLYGKEIRKVQLKGEAYFDVTGNEEKPFIVDLDGATITVLGTVFNAKRKPEENRIQITLVEGSIRFETPEQNVLLSPRQMLSYSRQNKDINIKNIDTETVTAWKNNLIKYQSLTFHEFLSLLQEYYDVEFVADEKLFENRRLTGTFDAASSICQILNLMKKNLHFNWEIKDNKYLITKQ